MVHHIFENGINLLANVTNVIRHAGHWVENLEMPLVDLGGTAHKLA